MKPATVRRLGGAAMIVAAPFILAVGSRYMTEPPYIIGMVIWSGGFLMMLSGFDQIVRNSATRS